MEDRYNKIVILCLAGIGDTLLFMPTLDAIIRKYPSAKIDVLVMYNSAKEILESSYDNLNVIWYDFMKQGKYASLKFMSQLRKNKYDLCITSYPANRFEYNFIAYLTGAKKRIAHDYSIGGGFSTGRFLQTDLIKQNTEKQGYLHNVDENLKLIGDLGINISKKPEIYIKIPDNDDKFAENYLKKNMISKRDLIIGVHAGTGETKNLYLRRWSKEKFAELIDKLIEQDNAKILLFGGPNEDKLKNDIKELVKNQKNLFLINNTSMMESIGLMKTLKVFVSNDSALMHIASALKRPVVAIFGPTNIDWVYPYNTKSIVVTKKLPCSPCYFYSKMKLSCPEKKDFECMKIPVKNVYDSVKKLIK